MRKIYMRAGMSPFDDYTPFEVIIERRTGWEQREYVVCL